MIAAAAWARVAIATSACSHSFTQFSRLFFFESFAASAPRAAHRSFRLLARELGPALLADMG
jgi:hypothetical protein